MSKHDPLTKEDREALGILAGRLNGYITLLAAEESFGKEYRPFPGTTPEEMADDLRLAAACIVKYTELRGEVAER